MSLEFTTSDVAARSHGIKVLVHGRAGSGKTSLIATAPDPLILSAEAGMLSLAGHQIPAIVIHNFQELTEAYQFILQSEHARQFKTICLDSYSEIGEQCLAFEKAKNKDPRKAYGEMQDQMIGWAKLFWDLPGRNVYFSAKTEAVKDEVTGVTLWGPRMPGRQVGPQLPYLFDEVFSLEVGKTPEGVEFRYLRTKTSLQYEAKDRSGCLDEYEEPNLTKVFAKIRGEGSPQ